MPAHCLRLRLAAILVGLWLGAMSGTRAMADVPDDDVTVNRIVELNKQALVLYRNLEVTGAAQALDQALSLCSSAHLADRPVAARTHLHLGVVYVSGLKKPVEGLAEFKKALAIDPKIRIAKSLLNPEVERVFAEAVASPAPQPAAPSAPQATPATEATPPASPGHLAMQHPPVTRGIRGHAVALKVQVPPGLGAARVLLAYLAEDSDLFLAREMVPVRSASGWYEGEIPAEATRGARVAYYLEAQDPDDHPIANHGSPEQPHHVTLAPEFATAHPEQPKLVPTDENPTAPLPSSGLWLVLALGGGGGYHSGHPEMNRLDNNLPQSEIHVSGFGMARLGHLAPEIGFLPSNRVVVSVQGRIQAISGAQDVVLGPNIYHPAQYAVAGLAKLTWLFRDPQRRLRPFLSLQAGAGQIRHTVTTPASANLTGCGDGPTCKDTVMGGLALAGVGGGALWKLDENLAIYAAYNTLVGAPNFMIQGDLNVGIAVLR